MDGERRGGEQLPQPLNFDLLLGDRFLRVVIS
jgi:hypothetical protein